MSRTASPSVGTGGGTGGGGFTGGCADGVIGGKSYLADNFGTSYPESIVEYEGRVYGYADNKSASFRYSRDGMTEISKYGRINDFKTLTKGLLSQTTPTYVFGGFDPVNGEFLLTPVYSQTELGVQVRNPQETFTFNADSDKWTSNYNYPADMYAKVGGNLFIAFAFGTLWLQDQNPICNNFFGVQYNSQIKAVFNIEPKMIKVWLMAGMKATDAWSWDSIETISNFYSPTGQSTNLIPSDFSNFEGVFEAAMLRNVKTAYMDAVTALINGDVMRGEILHVTITNKATTYSILYHIFTRSQSSLPTQRKQFVLPQRVG